MARRKPVDLGHTGPTPPKRCSLDEAAGISDEVETRNRRLQDKIQVHREFFRELNRLGKEAAREVLEAIIEAGIDAALDAAKES